MLRSTSSKSATKGPAKTGLKHYTVEPLGEELVVKMG